MTTISLSKASIHGPATLAVLLIAGTLLAQPTGAQSCSGAGCLRVERGDLPIILSAPHGGSLAIDGVTPRSDSCGPTQPDVETFTLAEEIAKSIETILGRRPYRVFARFSRSMVDADRSLDERCGLHDSGLEAYNSESAKSVYYAYHDALDEFADEVTQRFGRGLIIDLHGSDVSASTVVRGSRGGDSLPAFSSSEILGGSGLLGLLAKQGVSVYPPTRSFTDTPREPSTGGYITERHGIKLRKDSVDALQLEFGCLLRDSPWRGRVARAAANSIALFTSEALLGRGVPSSALLDVGDLAALPILTVCGYRAFGVSTVAADFNGDGFDDVAVGAPHFSFDGNGSDGEVRIYYGSRFGLLPMGYQTVRQSSASGADVTIADTSPEGDAFGWKLAAGDINGDRRDDLVVGIPHADEVGASVDDGSVAIFYGSSSGLVSVGAERLTQLNARTASETRDGFGWSVAVADFDGDGFDDVAAGVPSESLSAEEEGLVVLFYGSSYGTIDPFGRSRHQTIAQKDVGQLGEDSDSFGWALAAGDLNADGLADLAISAPFRGPEAAGTVTVVFGSSFGLDTFHAQPIDQRDAGGRNEPSDLFGWSLAIGDFDGDSFGDLAVGVPRWRGLGNEESMVMAFFGGSKGLAGGTTEQISRRTVGATVSRSSRLFEVFTSGDLDQDGFDDLIFGLPKEDDRARQDGKAVALFGSFQGLLPARVARRNQLSAGNPSEAGDQFGYSVAVGDFNGDGLDDIAVGTPFEQVEPRSSLGALYVLHGRVNGVE